MDPREEGIFEYLTKKYSSNLNTFSLPAIHIFYLRKRVKERERERLREKERLY